MDHHRKTEYTDKQIYKPEHAGTTKRSRDELASVIWGGGCGYGKMGGRWGLGFIGGGGFLASCWGGGGSACVVLEQSREVLEGGGEKWCNWNEEMKLREKMLCWGSCGV